MAPLAASALARCESLEKLSQAGLFDVGRVRRDEDAYQKPEQVMAAPQ